ncbi:MAG: FtsB family cell division protein [Armatimonadota bacterium]
MSDEMSSRRAERRKARLSRKRKTGRSKVLRRLTRVLIVLLVVAATWLILAKITKPYRISYMESKEISDVKKQIVQAEAENKRLKQDIEYIKKPEGKMVEARKLGFVKEGEVAVVVEQPNREQFELDQMKTPPVKDTFLQSWKKRIAEFFTGLGK